MIKYFLLREASIDNASRTSVAGGEVNARFAASSQTFNVHSKLSVQQLYDNLLNFPFIRFQNSNGQICNIPPASLDDEFSLKEN